jgi:YHS domain-containing protein
MKTILSTLLIATAAIFITQTLSAQEFRNVKEYNLQNQVGLKGYDPVSYFPEGGNKALIGVNQYKLNYMGVIYFFANAKNLDLFAKEANKYEPTYGGYCAYGMASGSKVDIDPLIYTINGNRLHVFATNRTKRKFDADISGHEVPADGFWKQISGEEPRK